MFRFVLHIISNNNSDYRSAQHCIADSLAASFDGFVAAACIFVSSVIPFDLVRAFVAEDCSGIAGYSFVVVAVVAVAVVAVAGVAVAGVAVDNAGVPVVTALEIASVEDLGAGEVSTPLASGVCFDYLDASGLDHSADSENHDSVEHVVGDVVGDVVGQGGHTY